jgi:hypothetical protein
MGSCASIQGSVSSTEFVSVSANQPSKKLLELQQLEENLAREKELCDGLMKSNEELRLQLNDAKQIAEDWKKMDLRSQIATDAKQIADELKSHHREAKAHLLETKKLDELRMRDEVQAAERQSAWASNRATTFVVGSSLPLQKNISDSNPQQRIYNQAHTRQSAKSLLRHVEQILAPGARNIVEVFLQRQNTEYVRRKFEEKCKRFVGGIKTARLEESKEALKDLGRPDADELISAEGFEHNHQVTVEEFVRILQMPSKIESWTSAIPWSRIIANVINSHLSDDNLTSESKTDPLLRLAQISDDEEKLAIICCGINYGVQRLLTEHIQELKQSLAEMDGQLLSGASRERTRSREDETASTSWNKFSTTSDMQCGTVSDFYKGLSVRIGMVFRLNT